VSSRCVDEATKHPRIEASVAASVEATQHLSDEGQKQDSIRFFEASIDATKHPSIDASVMCKWRSDQAPNGASQSAVFEHSMRAASKRALIVLEASKVSIDANFVIQASGIEARASVEAVSTQVVTPRSMYNKNRSKHRDDHRRD
jgi:hypothetical protein